MEMLNLSKNEIPYIPEFCYRCEWYNTDNCIPYIKDGECPNFEPCTGDEYLCEAAEGNCERCFNRDNPRCMQNCQSDDYDSDESNDSNFDDESDYDEYDPGDADLDPIREMEESGNDFSDLD